MRFDGIKFSITKQQRQDPRVEATKAKFERINEEQEAKRLRMAEEWVVSREFGSGSRMYTGIEICINDRD